MNRKTILGVVVALVGLSSGLASAQGLVAKQTIQAHVDWVTSDGPERVTLAGWAFSCATQGQQPYAVRLLYKGDDGNGAVATLKLRYNGLQRRDVAAAFPKCGGPLNPFTGYQLTFVGIPAGDRSMTLEWSDSRSVHNANFRVNVQP